MNVNINDIRIPELYKKTGVSKIKVDNRKQKFIETGQQPQTIIISQSGLLVDGYSVYVAAKELGCKIVTVKINTDILTKRLRSRRGCINKRNKLIKLYDQQNGKCISCGKQLQISNSQDKDTYFTIDHILPICRGGSNKLSNMQGMCGACNKSKNSNYILMDMDKVERGCSIYRRKIVV